MNNFRLDQTIYVDEVRVGVVRSGQSGSFTVTTGTHTVRAWDSVTGSSTRTYTFSEGETETLTIN